MANIKSAKKRVLTAERNRLRNVAFKSSIKTAVKKVLELAKAEDKDALNNALSKVYQLCDKAVVKGILVDAVSEALFLCLDLRKEVLYGIWLCRCGDPEQRV